MNDVLCEELLYDREQDLKRAEARLSAIQPIFAQAIKLTDMEFEVVASMVEAVSHPTADDVRLKRVATVLDDLFAAVKKWQQENQR